MAKGAKVPRAEQTAAARPPSSKRRIRRLEARLARFREVEAKRVRQLERARRRSVSLEARISGLRPAGELTGPASSAPDPGPRAYCMRERRMVSIVDPEQSVMRNGRTAISGTCATCGAHVVTTARGTAAPGA